LRLSPRTPRPSFHSLTRPAFTSTTLATLKLGFPGNESTRKTEATKPLMFPLNAPGSGLGGGGGGLGSSLGSCGSPSLVLAVGIWAYAALHTHAAVATTRMRAINCFDMNHFIACPRKKGVLNERWRLLRQKVRLGRHRSAHSGVSLLQVEG